MLKKEIEDKPSHTLSSKIQTLAGRHEEIKRKMSQICIDQQVRKELYKMYRSSGLPLTTKTQEQFDSDMPVLSNYDEWIPKKLALAQETPFTEHKKIIEDLWKLNIELINLHNQIQENPTRLLAKKIVELKKLHEEIQFQMSQISISQGIRRHLIELYRNSGLPFPPIQPEIYIEQVLLESNRWESKTIASRNNLPMIQSQLVAKSAVLWRAFHASVCDLEKAISGEALLMLPDKIFLEKRIRDLQSDQRQLTQLDDQIFQIRTTMCSIIQKLQINMKDESHLSAWDGRNNRCWHGYGGVHVSFRDPLTNAERKYQVPTRVKELMQIASNTTLDQGVGVLTEKIYLAKSKRPSCVWSNLFSWVTRHPDTEKLYNHPDNLSLDQFEFKP